MSWLAERVSKRRTCDDEHTQRLDRLDHSRQVQHDERSDTSGVVARPQVCGEVVEGEFAGACVLCSGVSTRCAASEARPRARRSV